MSTITLQHDKKASAAPGDVDIAGFPQLLHTRTFGDPDALFIPLLEGARDALVVAARLTSSGETRDHATTMSRIHLASGLLKDSNFSLSGRGLTQENHYVVDLEAETINLQTRLYAVISRRTSMFQVEIAGKIREGPYVARCMGNDSTAIQVEEEQLRRPEFFSTILGEECLRAQMEGEQHKNQKDSPGVQHNAEVRLTVPMSTGEVPVILKKKEGGSGWDVLDASLRTPLGILPFEAENHLRRLLSGLSATIGARQKAGSATAAATPIAPGAPTAPAAATTKTR